MTGKERVQAALNHQAPDRVPTGEYQINAKDVIEGVLGRESFLTGGLPYYQALWDGRRDEVFEGYKKDLVEFTLKAGLDSVLVHTAIGKETCIEKPKPIGPDRWEDSRGNIIEHQQSTGRMLIAREGNKPAPPEPEPPSSPEPTESELETIRYVVEKLGKTHFITCGGVGGHRKLGYSRLYGFDVFETWYMKAHADPEGYARQRLEAIERDQEQADRSFELARREKIDCHVMGFDYGHNKGPFVSPDVFRRAIFPVLSKLVSLVHEAGFPLVLHSCGNNRLIMDMIVDAGIDVYQSIQPEEKPEELKELYGDRIALWGGVPAATLVSGTVEETRKQTRWALENLSPGGGFVCATSHSVMPGAKYDNYMAMLEETHNFDPASRT